MALTDKDLKSIKVVVKEIVDDSIEKNNEHIKDMVEFAIDKSEIKMTAKIEESKTEILDILGREISDLAEMNREFLDKFDNHEHRIKKLELKTDAR